MHALSYRWWDMWKSYTSEHASIREQVAYLQNIKNNILVNDSTPDFLKDFMFAYFEE